MLKDLRNKYSHFTTDDMEILRQWRTKLLEDSVEATGDLLLIIDASITILNRVINYNSHPNAKPIKSMKQIKKEYDNHEKLNYLKKRSGLMKIQVTKKSGNAMLSKKQRKRLAKKERKRLIKKTEASFSKLNNFLIENTSEINKDIESAKVGAEKVQISPNSNFQVTEMPKVDEIQKVTPKQTNHRPEIIAFNSRIHTKKISPKMAEIQRLMEENENDLSMRMGTRNDQPKKMMVKKKKKRKGKR